MYFRDAIGRMKQKICAFYAHVINVACGLSFFFVSYFHLCMFLYLQNRGECETSSTWTGWVLSLCARMLEFAIVILLLLVTISSTDVRFLR